MRKFAIGIALAGMLCGARLPAEEPTAPLGVPLRPAPEASDPAPRWMVRLAVYEADADRLSALRRMREPRVKAAAESLLATLASEDQSQETRALGAADLPLLTEQGVLRELGKAEVAAVDGQAEEYAAGQTIDAIDPGAPDAIVRAWIGLRGELTATRATDQAVSLALRCEWCSANEGVGERVAGRLAPRIGRRAMTSNLQLAIGEPVVVSQHSSTSTSVDSRFLFWRPARTQTTITLFVATVGPAAAGSRP